MKNSKFFALMFMFSTISAAAGVMLGYFVFAPVGVSARADTINEARYAHPALPYEYASRETPQETEPPPSPEPPQAEPAHSFIVTSEDGFIVVYHAGDKTEITEVTPFPVNALPVEEQERLARGIRIYSEEALIRILEDYGS